MADNVVSDLIMKFVLPGGNAISGESSSEIDLKRSDMSKGFEKGKMFEVESFTFRTGIGGEDEESAADQKREDQVRKRITKGNQRLKDAHKAQGLPGKPVLDELPQSSSLGSYGKWRAGQKVTYPVDMSPVEFSRAIDKASAILLQNCIKRVNYESATLIKRKAAGGAASGEVFLRFDFTTVLMTRIDWDDDMPIKEKCQFISRAVTVHYLPQLPDGSLGAPIRKFWTMSPNLSPVDLKR